METDTQTDSFEAVVLPHLCAGYRLAYRLMRHEEDAEDVLQEACLRAFRYFRTFTGGDGRAWFLRIVRNTSYGWRRHGLRAATDLFDEDHHTGTPPRWDPESWLLHSDGAAMMARALRRLPDRLRDVLVLRELKELSYRELADTAGIPIGTVMSRLSRARGALRGALEQEQESGRGANG